MFSEERLVSVPFSCCEFVEYKSLFSENISSKAGAILSSNNNPPLGIDRISAVPINLVLPGSSNDITFSMPLLIN